MGVFWYCVLYFKNIIINVLSNSILQKNFLLIININNLFQLIIIRIFRVEDVGKLTEMFYFYFNNSFKK